MSSSSMPVAAAPFRSYVHHTCECAGVSWPIFALQGGFPPELLRQLLDPRPGRLVQRISAEFAGQVFAVTVADLLAIRRIPVAATEARRLVRELYQLGWTTSGLAAHLHVTSAHIQGVATGDVTAVPRLFELQLASLKHAAARRGRPAPRTPLAA